MYDVCAVPQSSYYADDLVVFALSVNGLPLLIDPCVGVGNELDIMFNEMKTKCLPIFL